MDELQLNFSTEPTNKQILNHSQVTNNLKRGSWLRRRVVAKKIVHRENKKLTTKSLDVPLDIELEPLTKNTNEQHVMKKKSNGTFVTSLFTSNPELPNLSRNIPAKTVTSLPVFSATTFAGTGLHSLLTDHLKLKLSVDTPTPIQRATIPHLIQCDQDAIIQAQTGSGKTYAFLLPILHRLISSAAQAPPKHQDFFSRSSGTFAIVLVPTRELAQQISTVLEKILSYSSGTSEKETRLRHWIVSGIVTGGEKRKSEKSRLRKGNSILVCTPGRLLDHLKTTDSFIVGNVRWLVLDEADNLLSLGFEQTLKEILQILDDKRKNAQLDGSRLNIIGLPESRQTILCSATIESGVQELAKQALINPVFLKAKEFETPKDDTEDNPETKKNDDDSIAIPQQLKQHYVLAPAKLRLVSLIGLLRQITIKNQQKIIIYISTGDSVDWHFSAITKIADSPDRDGKATTIEPNPITNATPLLTKIKNGYESPLVPSATFYKLHGNMLQSERQMTFQGFSALTDKSTILICTDVAARGLDLPNVTQVIQYDPPCDPRDYIHRIGRTARLGKEGQAFLFLLPSEADYIPYLEDIKCTLHEHPLAPLWKTLVPLKTSRSGSKNESEVAATDVHMLFERFVQSDQKNYQLAMKGYTSFLRAYATHASAEKHIFHIKKLHLGHIAKSFALREMNGVDSIKKKDNGEYNSVMMKKKSDKVLSQASVSEFSSGVESIGTYNLKRKR